MSQDYVEITLDRVRKLRFTIEELEALETRVNQPVGDVFANLGKLDIRMLRQVLWTGLRHDDRNLRFEKVRDLMSAYLAEGHTLADLLWAINQAIVRSGIFGREIGGEEPSQGES